MFKSNSNLQVKIKNLTNYLTALPVLKVYYLTLTPNLPHTSYLAPFMKTAELTLEFTLIKLILS
jgi:hypothetical protein